ncbi:DUF2946 family protein [Paraburkholderia caledonica]|jgi:hypothetical protein|uniref:DUF2946 family protein n=1 Tax=Paraburkholderia caledonica TaxID=134536 RepID=UPI000485E11F|nr:DUF2946 family protein [Paraburkholderia caledonica]
MTRLRHLQAQHSVGRWISYLVLLALALRLLLPTGLMLDTSTEGDNPGLVICSGHGPLVLPAAFVDSNADFTPDSQATSTFKRAASLSSGAHSTPASPDPAHTGNTASNEICPFSAAFVLALTAIAIILAFCHFAALIVARYRRQTFIFIQRLFRSSHSARAPPLFA